MHKDSIKSSNPSSPVSSTFTGYSWSNPVQLNGSRPQSPTAMSANAKRQKYIRRLFKFRQMDFEYALWQMLYLFVAPQKVYRNFGYRKQTKDQWARDDPAFLVLLTVSLFVSSIGFSFVLGLGFVGFIKFFLWVVFMDCLLVGILIATFLWLMTNRFLIMQPPRGQDVEWGYCFDIHLNAFFPLLMILHLFQLPFLYYLRSETIISCMLGNSLWLIAIGYYIYITFLGYNSLPFLRNTKSLLYPLTFLFLFFIISLPLKINFSDLLCHAYLFRSS